VPAQLLDHPKAVKSTFHGVMQDVEPNHPGEEFPVAFVDRQSRSLYPIPESLTLEGVPESGLG
jgi:hypothetical protein